MTGHHGMGSDSKDASCGDFQIRCVIIQRIIILASNDNLLKYTYFPLWICRGHEKKTIMRGHWRDGIDLYGVIHTKIEFLHHLCSLMSF